jgi:hypothetical protein
MGKYERQNKNEENTSSDREKDIVIYLSGSPWNNIANL